MTNEQLREMNRQVSIFVMHWYEPDARETEEILSAGWSELRHWTLHRHSGKPVENFSSYYWEPPPFSRSAIFSKLLRDKLAETWKWMLGDSGASVGKKPFGFGLIPKDDPNEDFAFLEEADTEELAVALAALRSVGVEIEKS